MTYAFESQRPAGEPDVLSTALGKSLSSKFYSEPQLNFDLFLPRYDTPLLNDNFCLVDDKQKTPAISQKTIDKYQKEFFDKYYSNLTQSPETYWSFESLCALLPNLSDKKLTETFQEQVAQDKRVNHELIMKYLQTMLESEGFKATKSKFGDTDGTLEMTNKATGVEISITYKLNKEKREKSEGSIKVKRSDQ